MIYINIFAVIFASCLCHSQIIGEKTDQDTFQQNTITQETIDQDTIIQETIDQDTIIQETIDQDTIIQDTIDENTVDLTPLAATCTDETVDKVFSAIINIHLISFHDPEIVFGLSWPSEIAADQYYRDKLHILQDKGLTNTEELASISASYILLANEFTLWSYYLKGAASVGKFLLERGLLSCDNVIHTAKVFFENEKRAFNSLDSSEFDSHVRAIIIGLQMSLEDLGYTTEENEANWEIISNYFSRKSNK